MIGTHEGIFCFQIELEAIFDVNPDLAPSSKQRLTGVSNQYFNIYSCLFVLWTTIELISVKQQTFTVH